jgi:hypothetical protein
MALTFEVFRKFTRAITFENFSRQYARSASCSISNLECIMYTIYNIVLMYFVILIYNII